MFRYIVIVFLLCAAIFTPVLGDYCPDTDYMLMMMEAVCSGDEKAGLEAEKLRDEKIAALGLEYEKISFEELSLLSKLIEAEAGSLWLSAEWKMAVGEVVLNRVASPEFPDSIRAVIQQPGQYYGANSPYLASLRPSMESIEAAKRLLDGERIICDPSVVFQANFPQGSSVHTLLYDSILGYTYLCCSNYPQYYEG